VHDGSDRPAGIRARGSAQGTTGSISGFVTDDTGGALPGATVTVRHIETDGSTRSSPTPAAAIARSSSRPGGTT